MILTIFVLLFVASHDASAVEYQMLNFTMLEEEPTAYPVGSIANASRPFLGTTNFDDLVYEFFPSDYELIFTLGDESGVLFTSIVIDRETECEFKTVCELIFDVLVKSKDGLFTQPFTVNVTIEDKNDNSPLFPKPSTTLEISEGSARGSTYSIDTAMDSDFGTNNSIQSYHLEPDVDSAGIFELNITKDKDAFSLKLVLKQMLNREVKDSYTVKVVAKDGGRSPNTGAMEIEVKVTDINDNPPIFSKPLYNVTVNESTPVQETIVRLSASDADIGENARISFRIREFQANRDDIMKLFSLVESTGEIKVKSDLTQVAGHSYSFVVEAFDHGSEPQSSQAEVLVHIHDSGNNAPEVSVNLPTGYVNIPESAATGTFVVSVNVIDPDSGPNGEINCHVDNQHFGIESFGGKRYKVVVSSVLDREVKDVHNVVVTCTDNGKPQMSGTVAFRVSLDDKNDNKPVFEKNLYTATIKENEDEPKIIAQVSATDADTGSNGIIHYALHADALNHFVIDNSGVITAVAPFDREKTLAVTFRVLAIDSGDTPLTGTATVVVSIDDKNDVKPKFNKTVYGFEIYENQPTGTDIDTLTAYDLDEGINADFDFSISPDYLDRVPFVLFSNGVLKANKMLDREETSRYDFVVVVTDHGTDPQSSSAHVTIKVKDLNDNKPMVNFPEPSKNDTVTVLYPGFESKHVAQIDAYDIDEDENKQLEYSIQSGNEIGIFGIYKDSGEVYFDSVIDIGSDQVIKLKINVSDKGSPKLSTVRDLYVNLKYTNATFIEQEIDDGSKNVLIAVVVVLVTLAVSGGIIALIFFLRTLDKKRKNKKNEANDSDFGFAGSGSGSGSHSTILSAGSLSPNSADPSRDLIKKKEVSFILNSSDSQEYHQQKLEPSLSSLPVKVRLDLFLSICASSWDCGIFCSPSSNMHAQPSSGAKCLIFGRIFCLLPYFKFVNSECSGATMQMRRLTWAFADRLCDKYHNLMSWLISWYFFQMKHLAPKERN